MVAEIEQGFSGKRTAEIVGITYRQLDYWARTDLVRPSLQTAQGSGLIWINPLLCRTCHNPGALVIAQTDTDFVFLDHGYVSI